MTLTQTRRPPSTDEPDADDAPLRTARRSRFLRHVGLTAAGIVMMYPLLWLVSSSLKPSGKVFTDDGLWPSQWDFGNYARGWNALNESFAVYLTNSFVIVTLSII